MINVHTKRIVVGADGRNSFVARFVDAPAYHDQPPQAYYYYTFWPDLPVGGLEYFWRHHRFVLAIPTNEELTCLVAGEPIEYFQEFAADVEKNYHDTIDIDPKTVGDSAVSCVRGDELEVWYVPPKLPELNPVEGWWNQLQDWFKHRLIPDLSDERPL